MKRAFDLISARFINAPRLPRYSQPIRLIVRLPGCADGGLPFARAERSITLQGMSSAREVPLRVERAARDGNLAGEVRAIVGEETERAFF